MAPPFAGGLIAKPGDGLIEHREVVRIEHRLDGENVGMTAERLHGPRNHGPPGDCPVLLGTAGTGAEPAPAATMMAAVRFDVGIGNR